jgi:hypothetical protein
MAVLSEQRLLRKETVRGEQTAAVSMAPISHRPSAASYPRAAPFKLRVEARGAFYFRTQCSGSADRRREQQQRHEYPFTFPIRPETPKKQIPFFGTSDSLYNYYVQAVCFGCGHQEENKWIRRSPVFWALRLY